MARDWFRKTTWTGTDASDFEVKLKRARATGRPQYVFIQAHALFETADDQLIRAALTLAERAAGDFPRHVHTSAALDLKGQCLERLQDLPGALAAYRLAVDAERSGGCILTDAYLRFAWLVATHELSAHQLEALALLDDLASRPGFPVQHFRYHAARALISDQSGRRADAVIDARAALDAAAAGRSGFAFHGKLGLVGGLHEDLQVRLRSLIAG
jgi:hypothetical protein